MRLTRGSRRAATPAQDELSAEEAPGRGGGIDRRTWFAVAAAVLAGVVAAVVVVANRDSPQPLDRAQVGTIASGVVDKAIQDLQSAPAPSAVAYQKILPSLVEIETKALIAGG